MKQHFFTISTVWLFSSTALAESLSQPDKDYVVLGLGAVRVITECPDYRGIPDGIRKLADQIGLLLKSPGGVTFSKPRLQVI